MSVTGGSVKANVTGNISAVGGHFVSTHSDVVLDASGKLTLTDSSVSAKEGVAHLYGSEGVTIAATKQDKTSVTTQAQFQTVEHAAVAQAGDNDAQAAYTEVIAGSGSTTTTTTTQWADSTVDANKIDIQSSKGGVTIDASDLKAANGIRLSAAQDVKILAQRGVANSATTLARSSLQQVGGGWDGGGTMELVTTTTAGGSSTQETLRASSLNAGAGTLSIESTGGNISGQSAQLSGKKILLVTTKTQDGTAFDKADGKPIAATAGGGSIKLESLQVSGKTVEQANNTEWSAMTTQTLTTVKGTLNATGDGKDGGITISANKDLALGAIALDAGQGHVLVQAGGNVNLNANADAVQTQQSHDGGGSSFWTTTKTHTEYQTQDINAAVTTFKGNDITIQAGDTLTNYAANIKGSGTVLQIAGKSALNYTATQSRAYSEDSKSSTSFMGLVNIGHDNSTTTALNTAQLGSKIFGNQVGIQAKDVVIKGSEVAATGLLSIKGTDSVTITAATNTFTTKHDEDKSMLGISANIGSGVSLNSTNSTLKSSQATTTSSASNVSGGSVYVESGGNTTVTASNVVAAKDLTMAAGGNINILAATNTDTSSSQSTSHNTSMGLMGGASARQTLFSNTQTAGNDQGSTTTQTTSELSANAGTLSLVSSGKITTQGAELLAQNAVNLTAKSIDLQAITNASTSANQFESNSFTVGAALAGTIGSKITAISDSLQIANSTSNDRLKGAATLKAGYDAYKLATGGSAEAMAAAAQATKGLGADGAKADPNSGSAFGVSVSVGINSSKQDNSSAATQSRGTNIQAKAINLTATEGDITATGAKLQAQDISLDAAKNINLLAAVNSTDLKSSNESHSLGGGVTFGVGQQSGISFQFNAGQANGNTNGTEIGFDNTLVTATNKLTVKSGGNTNLVGAQLGGNSVKMDVGGDLNVVTLQDKSNFNSEQHSSGISLSLCIPPLCVGNMVSGSISKSDSSIDHNYISATGQSGIAAGSGGYDITVKGNTDLKGGAITSAAPQDQNTLKTAGLTSSDLNNAQNTNSQSSSISLSYGGGSALSTMASNLTSNALANLGSGAGMPANGSSSGTTQSVISKGNITITGTGDATKDANSNTQVAALTNRDATKANGSLKNTLTLQQAQEIPGKVQTAAENAQIAQMVGSVAFNVVGDIAKKNGWAESSPQKIALHAIAGFVTAAASGGNGGTGALAAGVNEALTKKVNEIVEAAIPLPANATDEQKRQVASDRKAVSEAAATVVGAGAVAAAGGTKQQMAVGGTVALLADQNNRQLHPVEAKLIKDNAARYASLIFGTDQPTPEQVQAATYRLTNTAQSDLDNNLNANVPNFKSAESFLATLKVEYFQQNGTMAIPGTSGTQQLFYATTEQKNQPWLNKGQADPTITGLIDNKSTNTGNSNVSTSIGDKPFRRANAVANGQTFNLPVADCPAAGCTNGSPIAWFSSDPKDQANLAAYQAALDRQNGKVAVTAGLAVGTAVVLPATVGGAIVGGAIVGGGSNASTQAIDNKTINITEVALASGEGAVLGYGAARLVGAAGSLIVKAGATADAAVAITTLKVETGAGATGNAVSPTSAATTLAAGEPTLGQVATTTPKTGTGTTIAPSGSTPAIVGPEPGPVTVNATANLGTTANDSVWHATRTTGAAEGILQNGIDPAFLNPNSRFGSAFYVAEQPATSLAEMAHYGVDPTTGIRFSVNPNGLKVLDLTDPNIAAAWSYTGGSISAATQKIGTDALAQGYNAIRYGSERATNGSNLAILDNFNQILKPVMVTPSAP